MGLLKRKRESKAKRRPGWGFSIPAGIRPSAIPVTLVCGPPGAGKSTYCAERAEVGDIVIDFDQCKVDVGGSAWDRDPLILKAAFERRDALILGLARRSSGHAWLIVSAPSQEERRAWWTVLGPNTEIVVLKPSAEECLARLSARPPTVAALSAEILRRWYQTFQRDIT